MIPTKLGYRKNLVLSARISKNIKIVEPKLPPTDTHSGDKKTWHIQFVTKLLHEMKDSATAIFTDGGILINAGPTGAWAETFRAILNKPPCRNKLSKAISSNSITYHGEIGAILLTLKHIS